jgi:tRNA-splicing ligase RtcB
MTELLHIPVVKRGVIMPDACPSGGGRGDDPGRRRIEVENAIIPGAHSADICCSMFATFFPANHPVGEMMDHLQKTTHFGAGGRPRGNQWTSAVLDQPVWDNPFLSGLRSRAQDFLGTQGDGNHFAYLGRIQFTEGQRAALEAAGYTELSDWIVRREGAFNVLVTHHGSRGLGADVYKRGQKAARQWCDENAKDIPDSAVWLPGDSPEGREYWEALQYIARWTRENHALIHEALLRRLGQRALVQIGNEHNFVWKRGDSFFHGKGATPAWQDAAGAAAARTDSAQHGARDPARPRCEQRPTTCRSVRTAPAAISRAPPCSRRTRTPTANSIPHACNQVLAERPPASTSAGSAARPIFPSRRSATRTPPR